MPIDFEKKRAEMQELRDSAKTILQMQHDITALLKENYDEKLPPETVSTALLHMAARIGCQLNMNSKQFAGAAKDTFKAVAKELRG